MDAAQGPLRFRLNATSSGIFDQVFYGDSSGYRNPSGTVAQLEDEMNRKVVGRAARQRRKASFGGECRLTGESSIIRVGR